MNYKFSTNRYLVWGMVILISALFLFGCSSKSVLEEQPEENINVSVSASPTDVDLGNTVVVEATVLNDATPVADRMVHFQVTPGTAGTFSPDSILTDSNGVAATTFHPDEAGAILITASTPNGLASATNSVGVTVADTAGNGNGGNTDTGPLNSIFLISDTINLVVKATGGIETATLSAIGYDIYGNPVGEGIPISFIITNGPGGGEHLDTVGYGPFTDTTDSEGRVHVAISSGTISGTVRIRAYADTILSNAAQIMISAGPPEYLAVGVEKCNVGYFFTVNEEVGVVAVVSDVYHNPVNDFTAVYFTTDEGTMKSHEARTENLEGVAGTKWISGYASNSSPVPDGIVWVIAETAGGTVKDSVSFLNTWAPATFTLTGFPTSMPADGKTVAVVNIQAWDFNGNPVVDGTQFDADASFLSVEEGTFEYLCGGVANARVKITSALLDADYSTPAGNDDGIGAYDTVYYWSAGAYYAGQVILTTGSSYSGTSSLNGETNISLGETAQLSAIIKDRFGNPLGRHTLVMTPPVSGTAGGTTQVTNEYGEASGFTWTPSDTGSVNIFITDTDPRGGIVLSTKITVSE